MVKDLLADGLGVGSELRVEAQQGLDAPAEIAAAQR